MRRRLLALLILGALVLMLLGCSGSSACGSPGDSAACTRVLFIGNSYTFVNDLPTMFATLAASGGHSVETGMVAEGGATFADHAASAETAPKLASARWGIVVLQEQSQIPSVASARQGEMYPAARQLVRMVRAAGAEPVFFLTWAHRDGWPEAGMADYSSMQSAIDDGYLAIAGEQNAAVAPVGYAWWTLLYQEPGADLWQDDGSHPTVEGTYLAACVFYATIFRQSPAGLHYRAGLPNDEAATLQEVATNVVLPDPAKWGLR
ncbi:MAG: SGNH/GDSL hydrolase family protein [Gaiellaceae bacterium]|jgi:hypothetical protein